MKIVRVILLVLVFIASTNLETARSSALIEPENFGNGVFYFPTATTDHRRRPITGRHLAKSLSDFIGKTKCEVIAMTFHKSGFQPTYNEGLIIACKQK